MKECIFDIGPVNWPFLVSDKNKHGPHSCGEELSNTPPWSNWKARISLSNCVRTKA